MDSLVNQALESICSFGSLGIPICNLFQSVIPNPSNLIKKSIFDRLLLFTFLKFVTGDDSTAVDIECIKKFESLEELEGLQVRVVADEGFRSSFVGLDDLNAAASKVPDEHRRTLERIAATRTNGITQRDLAKEFGIKGNKFFYQVKFLESQQLIVRKAAILREREMGNNADREHTNIQVLHTQLLHLHRYSKSANSQQRVEITKPTCLYTSENMGVDDETHADCMKEDKHVDDFLPSMKAICDKLEEANQKVLVVSDIKVALNYKGVKGHRGWRNITNRLENAGLVKIFHKKIGGKDVPCLRLLKKFDPNDFQSKPSTFKYDSCDNDNLMKNGKQGYITDQLLELPLEHCIYDMVDAEGPKGITLPEVSKRLGMNSKKLYDRIHSLCVRFGMCMETEKPSRAVLYRIWTHKNYNQRFADVSHDGNAFLVKSDAPVPLVREVDTDIDPSKQTSLDEDWGIADGIKVGNDDTKKCTSLGAKDYSILALDSPAPASPAKPQRILALDSPAPASPAKPQQSQWHRLASSTELGIRREQLIIERLEASRFILQGELLKWLNDVEKDSKPTSLDRRTLHRVLNNLQKHGKCKLSRVSLPAVTNFTQNREHVVIIHPTFNVGDIMDQIYERYRAFEFQSHSHEPSKSNNKTLPVLADAEKSSNQVKDNSSLQAVGTNAFGQARIMMRAKLLHQYLWNYINSLTDRNKKDLKFFEFVMKDAIEAMPLEFFPQIVGATKVIKETVNKYELGLRLMDLSIVEKKSLLDTKATGRLSRVIDILARLKLIHLACQDNKGVDQDTRATPKHVMDLEPYIEAPLSKSSSFKVDSLDLRPRIRHDFGFSNKEDVDAYWQTLEYCYANADPATAKLAFPGTVVKELYCVTVDKRRCHGKRVRKAKMSEENNNASKKRRCSKDNSGKFDAETTDESCGSDMDIDTPMLNETETLDNSEDACIDNIHDDSAVESDPHEADEQNYSLITNRVYSSRNQRRKRRFTWTDEFDRKLVAGYARECVRLGDRFYRVKWSSLKNLPTDSSTCSKRMNKLKNDKSTRKAIMKLCNLHKERYIKYLHNFQTTEGNIFHHNNTEREDLVEQNWDDFENPEIMMVLDEIIRCKRQAKLNYAKKVGLKSAPVQEPASDQLPDSHTESEKRKNSTKPLKITQVYESTSIANAVELLKLIFLSYCASSDVQSSLAETLAHYPKNDIITAFNYLRDKEYVVILNEKQRPVLSRKFWHNSSASPFPVDSGKRASDFLIWLFEKSKNLEDEVDLSIDIYCGEILQICALLSSEELFISPSLPEEGVGETEESGSSRLRTYDESVNLINEEDNKSKKWKLESDFTFRREKGFPGIKVLSQRASVPKVDTLECSLSNEMKRTSDTNLDNLFSELAFSNQKIVANGELPYDEMAKCANMFTSSIVGRAESFTFCPEIFKYVCSVIDQAGGQGLNTEVIPQLICTKELQLSEVMVDTLELFEVAFKVMAFDSVRLVSSTYRQKYFIGLSVDHNKDSSMKPQLNDKDKMYKKIQHAMENGKSITEGHRITLLDQSTNPSQHQLESQMNKETNKEAATSDTADAFTEKLNDSAPKISYSRICPWINCDGSSNTIVCKGLTRRVLGIVMQNPGISEEDIVLLMDVLNPQSCLKFLETMVLDNRLHVRKMYQTASANHPPSVLQSLFSYDVTEPKSVVQNHYFANPMSASLL